MNTTPDTAWTRDFFEVFLGERLHQRLLPGLRSLTTSFTIEVKGGETFSLAIEEGVITRAEATDTLSRRCHLVVDADDFARVVAAEVTPQSLFIRRRLSIRGNPWHALRASSAMQEFFLRFPYRPAERVSR